MVNFVLPIGDSIYRFYKQDIGMNNYLDGILVSQGVWRTTAPERVLKAINYVKESRHKFVIGDCGAFTFFRTKELGFDVMEWQIRKLFDWYDSVKVDYGLTYDYIVPHGNPSLAYYNSYDKEYIYTLKNLSEMKKIYKTGSWKFEPIGALQFQNWENLRKAFEWAYKLDYKYVSVGGLVMGIPTPRDFHFYTKVIKIADEYAKKYNLKVHLLGVGWTRLLNYITNLDLNIYSVDSSSSYTSIARSEETNKETYLKVFKYLEKQYTACHYANFKPTFLTKYLNNDSLIN